MASGGRGEMERERTKRRRRERRRREGKKERRTLPSTLKYDRHSRRNSPRQVANFLNL